MKLEKLKRKWKNSKFMPFKDQDFGTKITLGHKKVKAKFLGSIWLI